MDSDIVFAITTANSTDRSPDASNSLFHPGIWGGISGAWKVGLICSLLLLAMAPAWAAESLGVPKVKQARVNGVTLVYQEQGRGAPVLFIHGCCTDYRAWDAQRRATAPRYRFIGLNMRYFGTAPWPEGESTYSQQTDVDDITSFIRGLNAGPVDLVGWSYSGPIVMLVALQHPELVRSLTMHEPSCGTCIADPAIAKIANVDRVAALGPVVVAAKAGDLATAARLTPIGVNDQPDFWDTAGPEISAMFHDNARTWLLALSAPPQPPLSCEMLHQISVPVLITVGAETRSYFRLAAKATADCIPDAQLETIPGRHLAIEQQPKAFNAALLQLLAKTHAQQKP